MYPIPITSPSGIKSGRAAGSAVRALLQRVGARLTAAANAVADRRDPKDNELPREYFRFPPI